jgi:hypothetical protein
MDRPECVTAASASEPESPVHHPDLRNRYVQFLKIAQLPRSDRPAAIEALLRRVWAEAGKEWPEQQQELPNSEPVEPLVVSETEIELELETREAEMDAALLRIAQLPRDQRRPATVEWLTQIGADTELATDILASLDNLETEVEEHEAEIDAEFLRIAQLPRDQRRPATVELLTQIGAGTETSTAILASLENLEEREAELEVELADKVVEIDAEFAEKTRQYEERIAEIEAGRERELRKLAKHAPLPPRLTPLPMLGSWIKVTVPRESYSFPQRCPDCLNPDLLTSIYVSSDERKLKAFYLVASKHEYLRVPVPFCQRCAARRIRWSKIGGGLTIFGFLGGFAVSQWYGLGSWPLAFFTVACMLPGICLQEYRHRVVRVKAYDEETVTFSFKRPEYAQEFMAANHIDEFAALKIDKFNQWLAELRRFVASLRRS